MSFIAIILYNGTFIRYVKLRVAPAPGMPGTFSRHRFQRKPLVSDPGMHHGTCVAHVPLCMSGSLTSGDGDHSSSKLMPLAVLIVILFPSQSDYSLVSI